MRLLIALLLLLLCTEAWAGPEIWWGSAVNLDTPNQAINGVYTISSTTVADTGTATINNGDGTYSIYAKCDGGTGSVTINLVFGVTIRDSLTCAAGETKNRILSYPVTAAAGNHFRVYATDSGSASWKATHFTIPAP